MTLLALNTSEIYDIFNFVKAETSSLDKIEDFASHNRFIEKKTESIDQKLTAIASLLEDDKL